jgi:YVTN family beta-propeller protein
MRRIAALSAALLLFLFAGGLSGGPAAVGPPRDMLVVLNKSDNTASVIDIETKKTLATLRVGIAPHEAELVPGGRVVVVSNYGTTENPGRTLTVLDLKSMASVGTVVLPEGARPHGLYALSADRMLVTAEGLKELVIAEPLHRRMVRRIPVGREISHMVVATPDGARAFVANIGSGSVTVVDLAEGKIIADIPTGSGAEGIDIRPGGAEVWVANHDAGTISVIDTATLSAVATLPAKEYPIRVKFTPDGRRALVSCAKTGDIAVFDAVARREIRRIAIDRESVSAGTDRLFSKQFGKSPVPAGILVAPDGKRAWVASPNADVVSVLDLSRLQVVDRIIAGHEPDGLAATFRQSSR